MVKFGLRFFLVFLSSLCSFNLLAKEEKSCLIYLVKSDKEILKSAFENYNFPDIAEFYIFEPLLRRALYYAHNGIDFYTKLPLSMSDMSIDHIIPRSKGGPDNVFNFVPTAYPINSAKGIDFRIEHLEALNEVRDYYGAKTLEFLKKYGAFSNRKEELAAAREYNRSKGKKRKFDAKVPEHLVRLMKTEKIVFTKKFDRLPEDNILKFFILLSNYLHNLTPDELKVLLQNKELVFNVDSRHLPDLDLNDEGQLSLNLFHRKLAAKLDEQALALEIDVYKIKFIEEAAKKGFHSIGFQFNPYFLELFMDAHFNSLNEKRFLLEEIFFSRDISREEFIKWAE